MMWVELIKYQFTQFEANLRGNFSEKWLSFKNRERFQNVFDMKISKCSHERNFGSFGLIFAQDRQDVMGIRMSGFGVESGGKITMTKTFQISETF